MSYLPEPHRVSPSARKFRDPIPDLLALAVKIDDPSNLERDAVKRCITIARLARAVVAQRKGVISEEAIANGLMPLAMLVYAVDCFEKSVGAPAWRTEAMDTLARAEKRGPMVHQELRGFFKQGLQAVHGLRNPRAINDATIKLALEPLREGLRAADPAFAFRHETANEILPRIREIIANLDPPDLAGIVRRIV